MRRGRGLQKGMSMKGIRQMATRLGLEEKRYMRKEREGEED